MGMTNSPNSKTDFLPKEWESKLLSDLFNFSGGIPASRSQLSNQGYCYLHYGDIHTTDKIFIDIKESFQDIPKLNINLNNISTNSLLKDGDIVFVDASEDLEGITKHLVVINENDLPFISGLHTIVAKNKTNKLKKNFLRFCFQTEFIRRQFLFYAAGAKVSGISRSNIRKITLPFPTSIIEQENIASVLTDVELLLENLMQLIIKKKNIKTATMHELLTANTRIKGFSEKWVELPLEAIVKPRKGQLITSKTIINGNIPVIAGGKQPAYFHSSANRFGKTITISASGASAGYISIHRKPIYASDCSTISESDKYNIEFLFYALLLRQQEIYSSQTGGAQPHVQPKELAPILIKIPKSLNEQNSIANILSDMDLEISKLETQLTKTKNLKVAIMQELLSGKTRLVETKAINA